MGRRPRFTLTPRQRRRLEAVRDRHPKPHLREKAAALLKVADGWAIQDVAAAGLLRPRARNTVAAWLNRYRARGLAGLRVRAGRGRKPAFSPLPVPAGGPAAAGRPGPPAPAPGRPRGPGPGPVDPGPARRGRRLAE
jgi:hypothetical protein